MTFQPSVVYEPEGENDTQHLWGSDLEMMQAVEHALQQHYPGHPWAVTASHFQGVVCVFLQGFMQWGDPVKINALKSDVGMRAIVRSGGALLERLGLGRSGFSGADWRTAMRRFPDWKYRNRKPPT